MKQRIKSNILLVASLILTAALIAAPFIAGSINRKITNYPDIIKGSADFSETTHSKISTLYLTGEWEVFEGKHIISESFSGDGTFIQTPMGLLTALQNYPNSNGCHTSYRIKIKNLDFEHAIVYVPHFAGSYHIFLNGNLITESGVFSENHTQANLRLNAKELNFEKDKEYSLVIEVSCSKMPGLYMTPIIADYDYALKYSDVAKTVRCIVFGIVMFCTFFILMYSVNKKSLFNSYWFPVLSFFVALRMILSTDGYSAFYVLFGSIDYEQLTLLICLSTFIIKIIALLFYTETLDLKIGKGTFIAFCCIAVLGTLTVTLFPSAIFNPYYFALIQAATLPLDIVILDRLAKSITQKVPYSVFYMLGYIAIISGLMVDCFYTNGLLPFTASSFMPIAFAISIILFTVVFAEKHTAIYNAALKTAELDRQLTEANTSIMISQIQPHFLYNALNTIKHLIKHDPKTAEKAVISFSKYLRGNMESITNKEPIPFEVELEHIKNYCDIELLRFGDKIDIIYNTKCTAFSVPALSIQPLVENAIKHGVTKKIDGGTVTVTSYENADSYIITVNDNGIGFDHDNPLADSNNSHTHLGIENVKSRLALMVNGKLQIDSTPNIGTNVTVTIPKAKENDI